LGEDTDSELIMDISIPLGPFTCAVNFRIIRPPKFDREERDGVTYLVGRDYELAYETTLHFDTGVVFSINVALVGELNQQVVVRDSLRRPKSVSGYAEGRVLVADTRGTTLFRGRYYDSRIVQPLLGDESLTTIGQRLVDHWENGFGEGPYRGHVFSLGVKLTREGDRPPSGQGHGHLD
jgi:hypothetical protein